MVCSHISNICIYFDIDLKYYVGKVYCQKRRRVKGGQGIWNKEISQPGFHSAICYFCFKYFVLFTTKYFSLVNNVFVQVPHKFTPVEHSCSCALEFCCTPHDIYLPCLEEVRTSQASECWSKKEQCQLYRVNNQYWAKALRECWLAKKRVFINNLSSTELIVKHVVNTDQCLCWCSCGPSACCLQSSYIISHHLFCQPRIHTPRAKCPGITPVMNQHGCQGDTTSLQMLWEHSYCFARTMHFLVGKLLLWKPDWYKGTLM